MPQIHPTAIVNSSAQLADDVIVGPFTIIEADVRIGAGTTLGAHVFVDNGARIGANVKIHQGAVIATPPQDLKYRGEPTEMFVGDNTEIREYCTLNRGTINTRRSSVGKNCFLMAYAHVAHDCTVGDHVILANGAMLGGHTVLGDWVIVGGLTGVHQFAHIGAHAMVGGVSKVVKDVPPYCLAGRLPARFEGLNSIGLRRRGFSRETIDALDAAYRALYNQGMNVSQAVEYIGRNVPMIAEVRSLLEFIAASSRGIIRAGG
ncbi:MAG: acyl-ACP--UDP-N-acetylglucosamine O-acyltransferase [Ignavibacteriae bacterium]|nr:acyl-ACP--UDP-N-acetylglucosamine O-acyltransferase [Ignavibacteriota bacterium]